MKQYRLLKDLPTFKAGQLAYISKTGNLIAGTPENQETTETGLIIMIYHETTLKKFPNILTEWFEEIELTDSIHWKPKNDDRCFILENANIRPTNYTGMLRDYNAWRTGRVFRTEEECEKARDRELAEVRLRRTSDFKPDFENGNGGWLVGYDHEDDRLLAVPIDYIDYGEPVRYATEEEAKRSISENREDWLAYLGIKEE